jgi:EAL domain-containing protein (putative c-di-GMP-specific phosphodiesterase class I)
MTNSTVPINFLESDDAKKILISDTCVGCRSDSPFDFAFEFAYQPIVDFASRTIFAHEALVRGPNGESAASILAQVNDHNRYQFDQLGRVKAVKGAAGIRNARILADQFLTQRRL